MLIGANRSFLNRLLSLTSLSSVTPFLHNLAGYAQRRSSSNSADTLAAISAERIAFTSKNSLHSRFDIRLLCLIAFNPRRATSLCGLRDFETCDCVAYWLSIRLPSLCRLGKLRAPLLLRGAESRYAVRQVQQHTCIQPQRDGDCSGISFKELPRLLVTRRDPSLPSSRTFHWTVEHRAYS